MKYNLVAIIASIVDFSVFVFLNNMINLWYIFATIISVTLGGITAFILNRNWVFNNKKRIVLQSIKYAGVWWGSLLLNTYGLYFIVENTNINETISKIIVALFVGIFYNFLMSKYFIFK